jgi:hypothetical protein
MATWERCSLRLDTALDCCCCSTSSLILARATCPCSRFQTRERSRLHSPSISANFFRISACCGYAASMDLSSCSSWPEPLVHVAASRGSAAACTRLRLARTSSGSPRAAACGVYGLALVLLARRACWLLPSSSFCNIRTLYCIYALRFCAVPRDGGWWFPRCGRKGDCATGERWCQRLCGFNYGADDWDDGG